MTIKEMSKLYKNINKAMTKAVTERRMIENPVASENFDEFIEHAITLAKELKRLQKFGCMVGVPAGELVDQSTSEESFLRWCLLNNIDWKTEPAEEEETEPEI